MTTIGHETSNAKFVIGFILGLLLIAGAIHSSYLESQHEAQAERKAYQDRGCVIYEDWKLEELPAKCNNDFVEHAERRQ